MVMMMIMMRRCDMVDYDFEVEAMIAYYEELGEIEAMYDDEEVCDD